MPRELIIGLAGQKGVGKSTTAEILARLIPDVEIVAWADALKSEVADMVDRKAGHWPDPDEIEQFKAEIYGPLCQGWGAFRRHQDPDYWITAWDREAPERVIVPDTRHLNEAAYIKAHGGYLVYITGPSRWTDDTRSSRHESERYVVDIAKLADFTFYNDSSLAHLEEQAKLLVEIIQEAGVHVGIGA